MGRPRRTVVSVVAVGTLVASAVSAPPVFARPGASSGPAVAIRVDQVGYPAGGAKSAYVMLRHAVPVVRFAVRSGGRTVLRGTASRDLGRWNDNYAAVYRLPFTRLRAPGRYRVDVTSPAQATSPSFRVAPAAALYRRLIDNGVRYFTSERDGAGVDPSVLHRRAANLTDRHADVHAAPHYDADDTLTDKALHRVGGPVDVSGGWFDAGGGYEKFATPAPTPTR